MPVQCDFNLGAHDANKFDLFSDVNDLFNLSAKLGQYDVDTGNFNQTISITGRCERLEI